MKAHLRQSRISPKKANVVAGLVRGKPVTEALTMLKFLPKKAAETLYKVVQSAASNATNNQDKKLEDLFIESIIINRGPVFRRFLPSTRGRVHKLKKPTTHISVSLAQK